jgi:hypothetical protein
MAPILLDRSIASQGPYPHDSRKKQQVKDGDGANKLTTMMLDRSLRIADEAERPAVLERQAQQAEADYEAAKAAFQKAQENSLNAASNGTFEEWQKAVEEEDRARKEMEKKEKAAKEARQKAEEAKKKEAERKKGGQQSPIDGVLNLTSPACQALLKIFSDGRSNLEEMADIWYKAHVNPAPEGFDSTLTGQRCGDGNDVHGDQGAGCEAYVLCPLGQALTDTCGCDNAVTPTPAAQARLNPGLCTASVMCDGELIYRDGACWCEPYGHEGVDPNTLPTPPTPPVDHASPTSRTTVPASGAMP